MQTPAISVAILSHNRRDFLHRALTSLRCQECETARREIVVVLNACSDGSRAMVEEQFANLPGLVLAEESELGLCAARNRALSLARAPVIAFLDDDAIASPRWLAQIVSAFERHDEAVAALGGPVEPIWESPRPDWIPHSLDTFLTIVDFGAHERPLGRYQYLVGANMAFRTAALKAVGGFSPELDRIGNLLLSNGDLVVQDALRQRGHTVLYHPLVSVRHQVASARLTAGWFWDRGYWQGYSDAVMSLRLHGRRPLSRSRRFVWALRQILRHPGAMLSLVGGASVARIGSQFTGRRLVGYLHASLRDWWSPESARP
jgi:glucosyl-dolichyl phosphate glucuronosyltransferase